MFCENCGAVLTDASNDYCTRCGAPIPKRMKAKTAAKAKAGEGAKVLTCPNCSAALDPAKVKNGRAVCDYCDSLIILDDETARLDEVLRMRSEALKRDAETRKAYSEKPSGEKEKEPSFREAEPVKRPEPPLPQKPAGLTLKKKGPFRTACITTAVLCLLCTIGEGAAGFFSTLPGCLMIGVGVYLFARLLEQRRLRRQSMEADTVRLPCAARSYAGKEARKVYAELSSLGFSNVELVPGKRERRDPRVESVLFGGRKGLKKGERVSKDCRVVILIQ